MSRKASDPSGRPIVSAPRSAAIAPSEAGGSIRSPKRKFHRSGSGATVADVAKLFARMSSLTPTISSFSVAALRPRRWPGQGQSPSRSQQCRGQFRTRPVQKDERRRPDIREAGRPGLRDAPWLERDRGPARHRPQRRSGAIDNRDRDEVGDVAPVTPEMELSEVVRSHDPDEPDSRSAPREPGEGVVGVAGAICASMSVTATRGPPTRRRAACTRASSAARSACDLSGFPGVTSHQTRSRPSLVSAIRVTSAWPSCGGLNEPPSRPMRMPGSNRGRRGIGFTTPTAGREAPPGARW